MHSHTCVLFTSFPCQQAIRLRLETTDSAAGLASKQAAFNELQPLVWRQMITQAQQYYNYWGSVEEADIVSAADVRADETFNGWLNIRANENLEMQVRTQKLKMATTFPPAPAPPTTAQHSTSHIGNRRWPSISHSMGEPNLPVASVRFPA